MAEGRLTRRLAAILAADMVAYSRLMEADEAGTIARQLAHREELIDPKIAEYAGRIVKTTGDGLLVEFASVIDAAQCAVDIQQAMGKREAEMPEERRIRYRIGINLGDIVIDGDDILGTGVNIAARLEALAEPGGIRISRAVYDHVKSTPGLRFADLGEKQVKNIAEPVSVYAIELGAVPAAGRSEAHQEIRFCASSDGAMIAYASVGQGPPLVKAPNWMNHLEYDWESPIWRHLLREMARDHSLLRFDQRGNGLSDWDVEDISFERFVDDLEAVVDAAGLERFPLFGISQGCSISIAYSIRHPERVERLVLYGGFARGGTKRGSDAERQRSEAMRVMIREGWGQDNPAFRQLFTTSFVPGGTREQMDWFNELQRVSVSPENAVRIRTITDSIEVSELLPRVTVPTLVLHCREDGIVPFDEGRRMAAMIPGARFVPLDGRNHLILDDEPAWPRFLEEVRGFLAEGDS